MRNLAHQKTRIPDLFCVRQPQAQRRTATSKVVSCLHGCDITKSKVVLGFRGPRTYLATLSGYPTNVIHDGERPDIGDALLEYVMVRLYENLEPDTKAITQKTSELG